MTYAELLAEIKLLSKRGDIDDKIAIALRMTTLRAHRLDFFWRDHVEVNISSLSQDTDPTLYTIDVTTQLTRFRQVNYVQYYDPDSGALGAMLDEIDPSNQTDEYNYWRGNVWYMSGTNLNIRFDYPSNGARLGYWQNPDVSAASYNSWIKDELPDLLVQGSLAYLFNMMGKQEEARALNRMVGFEPDPANRAPGMTLVGQLLGANIRATGRA
jgi:hypothetical protein